jgi:cell wall-associated NlpC family hydrolase
MFLKIFPRALAVCLVLGIFSISALAQNLDVHPKRIKQIADTNDPAYAEDDPIIISVAANAATGEGLRSKGILGSRTLAPSRLAKFEPLIAEAIDARLGSPYHWGSTGPHAFDCSGFVWSTFHTAGIDFLRGSARTLWHTFEAPTPEDQFKFGTLVFFNHQTHVGIVADENGFYHASRHHGVVYATFKGYWAKHVDGYRRVPLPVQVQLPPRTEE